MNWQAFKALYEIYETGKTRNRLTLAENAIFRYHAHQTKELLFTKNNVQISASGEKTFRLSFEKLYLERFRACQELLDTIDENTPQCRFDVDDVLILKGMKAQMENGELNDIREQIISNNETRRGVSLMFFKNEKHLESSQALERATKKILKIDGFADDRDLQYMYVLQCKNPKAIILCENLHFLRMPGKARENQIELWYAGGRNVEKLEYSDQYIRELPIYYLCDWDYDGLDIYRLVKERLPFIQLITPNGDPQSIVKTEHKSLWRDTHNPLLLSNLQSSLFNLNQIELLKSLIVHNQWIIEESNDFVGLADGISFEPI